MNEIVVAAFSAIAMIYLNIFPAGLPIMALGLAGGSIAGKLLAWVAGFGGVYIALCWILHKIVPDYVDEA